MAWRQWEVLNFDSIGLGIDHIFSVVGCCSLWRFYLQTSGCFYISKHSFLMRKVCSLCKQRQAFERLSKQNLTRTTETPIFFFFFFLRAVSTAYGGSLARGGIGATVAGLHHSHSMWRSRIGDLHHSSALTDPLAHWAKDRTRILMDASGGLLPLSHNGNLQTSRDVLLKYILAK